MMVRRLNKCLADQQHNLDNAEEVEEVDDTITARAAELLQTFKAQGDNFDPKLDSLLLRVQTNPPGGNINPTPSVAVAGNPNINTPVSINTLPSLGNSIQAGVGSLQLGSGSQYGGPPDLSLYPNTGSMVGPIHSTPRSFKTHTYNPNISVGSVPNQSFPRPVMKMKNQDVFNNNKFD